MDSSSSTSQEVAKPVKANRFELMFAKCAGDDEVVDAAELRKIINQGLKLGKEHQVLLHCKLFILHWFEIKFHVQVRRRRSQRKPVEPSLLRYPFISDCNTKFTVYNFLVDIFVVLGLFGGGSL